MNKKFINTIKTLSGLSYVHLHAVYSVLGHIHCIPPVCRLLWLLHFFSSFFYTNCSAVYSVHNLYSLLI